MVFRDDECRLRTDHAPANFTTIKHIALNLMRKAPRKGFLAPQTKGRRMGRRLSGKPHNTIINYPIPLTAILSLAIQPLASHLFSFFATIFLWGGICYAIYTLGLVKLGQQFSGADLVAGSAACGATWGVGGLIGTPLAGAAMGKLGSWGFPTSMAIAFGILLSAVLLMSQKRSCHNRTPPSGGL